MQSCEFIFIAGIIPLCQDIFSCERLPQAYPRSLILYQYEVDLPTRMPRTVRRVYDLGPHQRLILIPIPELALLLDLLDQSGEPEVILPAVEQHDVFFCLSKTLNREHSPHTASCGI